MLRQGAVPSVSAEPSHICSIREAVSSPTGPPVNWSHRSYVEGSRSSFQRKTDATVVFRLYGCVRWIDGCLCSLILPSLCIYCVSLAKKWWHKTLFLHLYRDISACINVETWISKILSDRQTPWFYCWIQISGSFSCTIGFCSRWTGKPFLSPSPLAEIHPQSPWGLTLFTPLTATHASPGLRWGA